MIITNLSKLKPHRSWQIKQFLDLEILDESCVLAGGALRSLVDFTPVNDYDIFLISENLDDLLLKKKKIEEKIKLRGFKQIFNCPKNELSTFKLGPIKIQIINIDNKIYKFKEDIINEFDFHLCRLALDHDNDLLIDIKAIENIKRKYLSIHKITNPSSTINRFVKYKISGYNIFNAVKEFSQHFATNIQLNIPMNLDVIYVD